MGSLAQAAARGYLGVPQQPKEVEEWMRLVANTINSVLLQGKLNNTGSASLKKDTTVTTISDVRVTTTSVIIPMALNHNAASALAAWHVPSATLVAGQFVLTHASTSTSDCAIYYAILG